MDIINLLTGKTDLGDETVLSSPDITYDTLDYSMFKQLNGMAGFEQPKQGGSFINNIFNNSKQVINNIKNKATEIYNTVNNNQTELANTVKSLSQKVESLHNVAISTDVTVHKVADSLILSPADKLRQEDDNREQAQEILTEALNDVFENSEAIANIDDKLMNMETSGKVKDDDVSDVKKDNGYIDQVLNTLIELPGLTGAIADFTKSTFQIAKKPFTYMFDKVKGVFTKGVSKPNISKPDISKPDVSKPSSINKSPVKTVTTGGKNIAKNAGKTGLKSLVKKIPLIGALAGAGFAIPRLLKGDYSGAAMEFASGAASSLPGVGTAASVALDAALFAKDMKNEQSPAQVDLNIDKNKTKKVIESSSPTSVVNENNYYNSSSNNVKNISVDENDKNFVLASKF